MSIALITQNLSLNQNFILMLFIHFNFIIISFNHISIHDFYRCNKISSVCNLFIIIFVIVKAKKEKKILYI